MRIGLIYDVYSAYPWKEGDPPDADAEYEPEATVEALADAIQHIGHTPIRIGTGMDLLHNIESLSIDAALNIAEGAHGRNREAHVPALLELAGIPYLGSDGLTLSLSLDKSWAKDLAVAAGVRTPPYRVYRSSADLQKNSFPGPFPLFVKPRYEGSSKGITPACKVHDFDALSEQIDRLTFAYRQDVLVETFIEGGGEFTVAVVGNDPPDALPALQRAVEESSRIGLHALERRGFQMPGLSYALDGVLTPELEARLQHDAMLVYEKLECKDFARIDFRVDAAGNPWFLEINPLPTFAPDGTFAILAELIGKPYQEFLADTLRRGLERIF